MTFNRHDIEPHIPGMAEKIRLDFKAYKDRLTPELVERIIYFRLLELMAQGVGRGGESTCPSCDCPTKFGHDAECQIVGELFRVSHTECRGIGCDKCGGRGLDLEGIPEPPEEEWMCVVCGQFKTGGMPCLLEYQICSECKEKEKEGET